MPEEAGLVKKKSPSTPGATLKFKGWDWTELLRVWPESRKVEWPKDEPPKLDDEGLFESEARQAAWIRAHIDELRAASAYRELTDRQRTQIANCRAFVAKVGAFGHIQDGEVFAAIARIEDDVAFLQYLDCLLTWMWT